MRLVRTLPALAFAAALALAAPAMAAGPAQFTQPAFAMAQQQGKPILIEIDASWCPVCAQQRPILGKLMEDPAFRDLVVYKVDFDSQKDVVRGFGAQMQSTLIVFHGGAERGRSTGDTNADTIRALLAKSAM
jgi:thioredoxin 1